MEPWQRQNHRNIKATATVCPLGMHLQKHLGGPNQTALLGRTHSEQAIEGTALAGFDFNKNQPIVPLRNHIQLTTPAVPALGENLPTLGLQMGCC